MTSVIGSGSTEHCELCKEIVKYEKYTRTKLAIETASEEVQMVDLAEKNTSEKLLQTCSKNMKKMWLNEDMVMMPHQRKNVSKGHYQKRSNGHISQEVQ